MRLCPLTLTVSFPMPVFPPVTTMIFPERSGIWSTSHLGFGRNMFVHVL